MMDALRDFHGAPPSMDFSKYYQMVTISTINSLENWASDLASYVEFLGLIPSKLESCFIPSETLFFNLSYLLNISRFHQ